MTSSLVGSEMCIRDRHWHAKVCVMLPITCNIPTSQLTQLLGQAETIPVSYTHLTLPTICSV
eukprot:2882707-Prorocentrum_lima.AAC.1